MGDKGLDFKHKEVININNGKRLGYVQDVCADLETGMITSIIVPGSNKIMSFLTDATSPGTGPDNPDIPHTGSPHIFGKDSDFSQSRLVK